MTEQSLIPDPAPLPEFDGITPSAARLGISGSADTVTRPLHLGDRVLLVVEAEVTGVNHRRDGDERLLRVHSARVVDAFEVAGRPGGRLLATVRGQHRTITAGQTPGMTLLDELDDVEGIADSAGVILTPTERADLGLDDGSLDACVIVFHDQARAVWPDDFEATPIPRPHVRDLITVPGGDDVALVVEVLDAATGEPLEALTDPQIEAALDDLDTPAEADTPADDLDENGDPARCITCGGSPVVVVVGDVEGEAPFGYCAAHALDLEADEAGS